MSATDELHVALISTSQNITEKEVEVRSIVQGPPGVSNGGIWGTQVFRGAKTHMCCLVGFTTFLTLGFGFFPGAIDEEVVYWVDGVYYDQTGQPLNKAACSFKPTTAQSAVEILQLQR